MIVKLNANDSSQTHTTSFCKCNNTFSNKCTEETITCDCGEEYDDHEWTWDDLNFTTKSVTLSENKRDVLFHQTFSSGTAAVRGDVPFEQNCHYYWEIKMLTALYGTDVMVGVGTGNVNMNLWPYRFCSLLGIDNRSWGYSYLGHLQHCGKRQDYGPRFGQGSIIGVHLDMCSGTVEFYHNRHPLGVAFTGLKGYRLYPMVCSTAARSAMRVTCSLSMAPSLQLLSLQRLTTEAFSDHKNPLDTVPGLRNLLARKFWWMISSHRHENPESPTETNSCALLSIDEDTPTPPQRKRKRQLTNGSSQTEAETSSARLSDGPTDAAQLMYPCVHHSSDIILAPCENCGIVRAVGSKRSNRINHNRICLHCDGFGIV